MYDYKSDSRFEGIEPFKNKIWLSSPTMHGDELKYITEAYETNWMSTVGKNINEMEQLICEKVGVRYAVGTASLNQTGGRASLWHAGCWPGSFGRT